MDDLNELSPVSAGLDGRSPWWARELLATAARRLRTEPEGRRRTPRNAWRALSDRGWDGDLLPEVRARRVRPAFR